MSYNQPPSDFVCYSEEYRGTWNVRIWPYVAFAFAVVALLVIIAAIIL